MSKSRIMNQSKMDESKNDVMIVTGKSPDWKPINFKIKGGTKPEKQRETGGKDVFSRGKTK